MSHTKLGKLNINQAQSILIVWGWNMVNDSSVALWASQHVELRHDIGYGTRWRWTLKPWGKIYGGSDETWVEWKPGEGITTDIMEDYGGISIVGPQLSASIRGNFDAAFTGSLLLPGPAQNSQLKEFWDDNSDDGAQFHLKVALYQQERANAEMSASEKLDEHDFSFLFGITTDTPPLRVLETRDDGSEQPHVGVYVQ
ncbi:MAG: hypothetical protein COB10_11490 [Planctomycetota bacterium]|nr:MAG: hypothetical protein COB10_11490 [Planctomycetota bacterium]